MAGRLVGANADGDAAFGPLGTGQPPEWSVTGRPAQEGDEDRSTWLTGRFELGRNDTRACCAGRSCLQQPIGGIDESGPVHRGAWHDRATRVMCGLARSLSDGVSFGREAPV